eukprot:TRINITY_DN14264_c0_g1_i1.p1 TRINITY_DN14264_c0_g1~~TRINITY_DN14264_c0_g1_i1.p1  ORF type:complete len:317 (+),score=45.62 TRINITY_DN14264_c0_g1_i1:141-953(+)
MQVVDTAKFSSFSRSASPVSWPCYDEHLAGTSRCSTPLADYHSMRQGMSPSGYRSPATSHRGAPPLATERSRQAHQRREEARAELMGFPGKSQLRSRFRALPRKDEQLDLDEQGVGFMLGEEALDADAEVERIAQRIKHRSATPQAALRPNPRASPASEARAARELRASESSPSRTPSRTSHPAGVQPVVLRSPRRKEIWAEMVGERRKQFKERSVILRNMRKMPFREWDKEKDLKQAEQAQQEIAEQNKDASPQSGKGFGGLQFSLRRP